MESACVRPHGADQPHKWHVNDGAEVFVAETGDEHVAYPRGGARVVVIERKGSV